MSSYNSSLAAAASYRYLSPAYSLDEMPISETSGVADSTPTGYDRHRMEFTAENEHFRLSDAERKIVVLIRDLGDVGGSGMLFTFNYTSTFEHVLNAFKAKSCKICKMTNTMRFRVENKPKKVAPNDTPKMLGITHGHTLSIKVFSNTTSFKCASCETFGYPTTNNITLDGNKPIEQQSPTVSKPTQPLRLLFDCSLTNNITCVKLEYTAQLSEAMGKYARLVGIPLSAMVFSVEGERIIGNETPEELGISDRQCINVNGHVHGG